jgi:hypothetical protein
VDELDDDRSGAGTAGGISVRAGMSDVDADWTALDDGPVAVSAAWLSGLDEVAGCWAIAEAPRPRMTNVLRIATQRDFMFVPPRRPGATTVPTTREECA